MTNQNSSQKSKIKISLMGIGKAGNNIVENIIKNGFNDVEFIFASANQQQLNKFDKYKCIFLNSGNGESEEDLKSSNLDPKIGRLSALNSASKIKEALRDTNILIVTAGFGGSIGTGATPIIAKIAKEMGILIIAIVSTPFSVEGSKRKQIAVDGLKELDSYTDSYVVISNDKISNNYPDIAIIDAFQLTNNVLKNCVKSFIDLSSNNSIINQDFSDLCAFLKDKGKTYIGFGNGVGRNKINRAINATLNSKVIEIEFKGAKNAILNIITDPTVSISQVNSIIDSFKKSSNSDLNVIFNYNINDKLRNEVQISVIATYEQSEKEINNGLLNEEKSIDRDTQELLLKIKNTLELEITNQQSFVDPVDQFNSSFNETNNQDEEEIFITLDDQDEDDIPFFLK